ncbi:hypothetical protein [Streptomyces sp. NPDC048603]|uniref:hypothetical protein n=1 Tax=Streptomyces sp. NPDC048603 TaxID=3365577 RepID=UPI00371C4F86
MAARPVALTRALAVAHPVLGVIRLVRALRLGLAPDGHAVCDTPDEAPGRHVEALGRHTETHGRHAEDLGRHIEAHGHPTEAHHRLAARGNSIGPDGRAPLISRTTHLQERHCPATSAAGSPC